MPWKLKWNGVEIAAKAEAGVAAVVGEVTQRTAARAAANHPWHSETGQEEASIHAEGPYTEAGYVKGFVHADGPAFFLEVGTVHMAAYPFLRPAMDAEFPLALGMMKRFLT